ncbi:hypothetical protein GTZ99_16565 [Novosphingobium sp. FSY-8]|uniref:Glycosyl hydrolase family 32 n=1 Tax=Novosphingobium ovatum TaxID=1908523 RepID=A0ABW9XHZ1_9SPHN|nr:hypothetical protein [Novosphingobium ovatum]NBC38165.1 hypothetical protein [Novosphingobium ovatum]
MATGQKGALMGRWQMLNRRKGAGPDGGAGLVLGPGPDGACDDYRLGGAMVDHDPDSGQWRMWYYARDRAQADSGALPPTLGTGRIAMATSADGRRWRREAGPAQAGAVLAPSPDPARFDSLHLGISDITRLPHGWLMWYFGGDTTVVEAGRLGAVAGLRMLPGLARSRDGVHWHRCAGAEAGGSILPIATGGLYAAWPNAFHDGTRWICQVTEASPDLRRFATMVWTSPDACAWEPLGQLAFADAGGDHDAGGMVTRQVLSNPIPHGRRFLMIYTAIDAAGGRSIAAADSDDGLIWHRLYGEPVFHPGPDGAWDSLGVAATRLVVADGRLHFYYYGFQSLGADQGRRGIGLALAPLGDLRRLTRWKGGDD